MAQKTQDDVAYSRENDLIVRYREILSDEARSKEEYREAFEEMYKQYIKLLDDTKLLTSLGDRLQRKLRSTNLLLKQQSEEIREINEALNKTNVELKLTIDELTRARASRKARVITFLLLFALFAFSETLEDQFDSFLDEDAAESFIYSFAFKTVLFALLTPLNSFIEKFFVRQTINKDKKALLESIQNKAAKQATFVERPLDRTNGMAANSR
jgi:hypothetical protein